jgi:hypothetical protein
MRDVVVVEDVSFEVFATTRPTPASASIASAGSFAPHRPEAEACCGAGQGTVALV